VDSIDCAKKDFLWGVVWIRNYPPDFVVLQTLNALDVFTSNLSSFMFTALPVSGMIVFLWVCLQPQECYEDFIQALVLD
jgi:hypothetical protein